MGVDKQEGQQASEPFTPNLSEAEQEQVEQRSSLRADVVHEAIRKEGDEELRRPPSALAWSGLAAGLSMGFSLVAEGLIQARLPDEPWRPLVSKLGYPVGYLIVILGRQQLFTENTLTVILPLLVRRDARTLLRVLRLWGVVLGANLAGVLGFVWAVSHLQLFEPAVQHAFAQISQHALGGGFWTIVLQGVFAGWLVALLVWLLPFAEAARVSVIVIITYLVGLGGFAHIIAGSVDMLYLVMTGAASWGAYFTEFAAPTLLGNILGGVTLVAVINHAQVVSGGGNDL